MTLAQYRKGGPEPGEGHEEVEHEAGGHAHPGAAEYLRIGLILAVVTAIEVALYYVDLSQTVLVTSLMLLSAIKFGLVVLWFMHLKFDNPLFRQMFFGGLALAVTVFAVALSTIGGQLV